MRRILPPLGVGVVTIPREQASGEAIGASRARRLLAEGKMEETASLAPVSTYAYLLSRESSRAREKLQSIGSESGHAGIEPLQD